jgi:hypothetical protein
MKKALVALSFAVGLALAVNTASYASNPLTGGTVVADQDLAKVKGTGLYAALYSSYASYYLYYSGYYANYGNYYNYSGSNSTAASYYGYARDYAYNAYYYFYYAAYCATNCS